MNWYLEVLKKYGVFNGRARRKEYWMFVLFNIIILFVLGFVEGLLSKSYRGVLGGIYQLAVLIPTIAVGIRRMHDTDHNGWWFLFPVVNMFLAVRPGQQCDNRYGPDPKANPLLPTKKISSPPSPARVITTSQVTTKRPVQSCNKAATLVPPITEALQEEDFYAQALEEFESSNRKSGVWAKFYAESEGNESQAKAKYLKIRAKQLAHEYKESTIEQQRAEQEAARLAELAQTFDEHIANTEPEEYGPKMPRAFF